MFDVKKMLKMLKYVVKFNMIKIKLFIREKKKKDYCHNVQSRAKTSQYLHKSCF